MTAAFNRPIYVLKGISHFTEQNSRPKKTEYFLLKWLVHPEVVTIIQIKRIRQVKHVGRLKQVDPKAEEAKNSC